MKILVFILLKLKMEEIALKKLKSEEIDIVLLDNKLPGISGIEILDILNKEKHNASVIMITSYASLDLAVKATQKWSL